MTRIPLRFGRQTKSHSDSALFRSQIAVSSDFLRSRLLERWLIRASEEGLGNSTVKLDWNCDRVWKSPPESMHQHGCEIINHKMLEQPNKQEININKDICTNICGTKQGLCVYMESKYSGVMVKIFFNVTFCPIWTMIYSLLLLLKCIKNLTHSPDFFSPFPNIHMKSLVVILTTQHVQ